MHPILKENEYILKETNLDIWRKNKYTGKNIHVVIFDKLASPHEFLKPQVIAPFCPKATISHGTNVASVIAQFSECKITMLSNTNECREYFKQIADTVDIVNISMSADKSLAEHNWGFLEQYDLPIFVSSGNDGDDELNYPSAFNWTISVGAYSKDRIADYSNYSNLLDCVGYTDVYVLNSEKQSFKFNGTSCSSPQVVSIFTHYAQFIKDNYNRKVARQEAFDFVHNNCVETKETEKDGYGLFVLSKEIPIIEKIIIPILEINSTPKKLWRCQANAFSQKSNAEAYQQVLKEKGYNSYIVFINGLYKCQLNAFSLEANARSFSQKLKDEGVNNFIVYY